jgi:hypothetical protein
VAACALPLAELLWSRRPRGHSFLTPQPAGVQVAEAARAAGIKRFWYASSACIYPEHKQVNEDLDGASGLKEDDAWPAQPQDAYGLEKLMTEELLMHYDADFGMEARIGRFHNIYGPCGTWKGGREKAPAAFCRKGITSDKEFEMWGNGAPRRASQTHSCAAGAPDRRARPPRPTAATTPPLGLSGAAPAAAARAQASRRAPSATSTMPSRASCA